MSLTGTHHAFASIDERGTNRALHDFFTARPRYLHFGSPPFVTATSVSATVMAPIPFPGSSGIAWAVDLTVPQIDLFPPDGPLPAPLVLGPDQLGISTEVTLTIGCTADREVVTKGGGVVPVKATLAVLAIAHPVSQYFGPGVGDITFHVDQVLLPDVAPPALRLVLDCLIEMILNAVLAEVQLPFTVIDAGFIKLALEAGPTVADNQIELWGDIS